MTTPHLLTTPLAQMPALAELFRLFLSGKHLNRMAEPALWAELEKHEPSYVGLFAALGFELRLDARGFAWFHSTDANSNIGKVSRQLALLFMVIFDAQANAGKALQRFTDWLIDREWLAEVYEQQKDLLDAEGLSPDGLIDLLGRACTWDLQWLNQRAGDFCPPCAAIWIISRVWLQPPEKTTTNPTRALRTTLTTC
jgi:hypothetical protein